MTALEQLAERGGGEFPHLLEARRRTEDEVPAIRARVASVGRDADTCIVLFGSWGRGELTKHSDDDWVILVDGSERDGVRPSVDEMERRIPTERKPGSQEVFGCTVFCDHLVGRIGLQADDTNNLTRRILLLLESRPIAGDSTHRKCWERVLDGYLDESLKDYSPPRFFLNDVMRYWRQVCVDFVGKEREGSGEKWALRNLKLRTSRKILFASGLLPILLCHRHRKDAMRSFLTDQLRTSPLDRLAAAFIEYGSLDAGVRTLGAYDRWMGMLNDKGIRTELAQLARADVEASSIYSDARRLSDELEQGLLALLFEPPLEKLVREYAIF